jgi:crotonobetainyl-CoA:carnitine CoA-transferase CaiB-like acyl-CoA transferase
MLDAVISWVAPVAGVRFLGTGKNPERGRMPLSGGFPCYNVYESADGKFISLGALEPHFWTAFCAIVECNDLVGRQFDADAIPLVAAILHGRTREEWLSRFREMDACVEPVNALDEMMQNPQVRHRGLVVETGSAQRFGSPFQFATLPEESPAPTLGEHTQELLRRAGVGDEKIQELAAAGVIKTV